ncbi:alpha/beta hydrolase fold domain-containing protein [Devosia sediminis]|uniref:Alpha/beta hydrolase fold domain-containing protein n=1 Tax=Devosia sediminis TaxID=2798801 RepID=A0A934IVQ9_9HYPH|nr:alpha/beta hydrolase fold domain-containing protein [Devosia sediminis]MBJ3783986.1 alpha/beta hydrolase fold domain-containing protein [Devosia sediminis]
MASPAAEKIRAGLVRFPPSTDLAAERAGWEGWAAGQTLPAKISETFQTLGGVPGRLLVPAGAADGRLVVAFHGGGLVSGASVTHRMLGAELALACRQKVFLPDYSRLPENSPQQVLADGIAVLSAARSESDVTVYADSSGAALALAAMQSMRDAAQRLPDRVVFFSAAIDATLSGRSFIENEARDPTLSHASLRHWQSVLTDIAPLDSPLLSPLFQPVHGLPPMLLLAGSDELWRDDSVRLAEQLRIAGGQATLRVYKDMWHVWPMSGATPETYQAFAEFAAFLA